MGLQDGMAALAPGYLSRAEDRLIELRRGLVRIEPGSAPEALGETRIVFHDLAGTAPVMGFTVMGARARQAEDLIHELGESGQRVTVPLLKTLLAVAEQLLSDVTEARRLQPCMAA